MLENAESKDRDCLTNKSQLDLHKSRLESYPADNRC